MALGEIPGRKQKNAISRSQGHLREKNLPAPKVSPKKCLTFSLGPFWSAEQKGPKNRKKCYHAIRDNFPQLSREQLFFRSDPQVGAKGDLLGFWPVLGRGHAEKFRAQVENRKTQFSGARGPKIEEKKGTTLSGMVVRNFFTFHVLPNRTPRGGKSKTTGILGRFGLWHLKQSWARVENGEMQLAGARGLETENKGYHAIRDGCPQLFYILCFDRPNPQGQEIAKYWFLGPF